MAAMSLQQIVVYSEHAPNSDHSITTAEFQTGTDLKNMSCTFKLYIYIYSQIKAYDVSLISFGRLLAICLEQVTKIMNSHKKRFKKRRLVDKAEMLMMICLPRSNSRCVASHIRQLKCRQQINPIKTFYETGKPPAILHVVPFVKPGVKLFEQPQDMLPEIWKNYLINDYPRSVPLRLKEPTGSKTTSNISSTDDTSNKSDRCFPVQKDTSKLNGQFKSFKLEDREKGNLFFCGKRLPKESDNATTKISNNKKVNSKSSLVEENNVIRCKVSSFSKVRLEKRTTDSTFQRTTTSDHRPNCDQTRVRDIERDNTKELKGANCHNKYEIRHNKMLVSELINNEVDTYKNNCNSLCVPNCDQFSDGDKKTTISNNSCNGELKGITKVNASSKPTERCVSGNSVKLKLSSHSVSHKPRPPSTVKLKGTPNLTSKYNLYEGRFKVPTSFVRSQRTPKS